MREAKKEDIKKGAFVLTKRPSSNIPPNCVEEFFGGLVCKLWLPTKIYGMEEILDVKIHPNSQELLIDMGSGQYGNYRSLNDIIIPSDEELNKFHTFMKCRKEAEKQLNISFQTADEKVSTSYKIDNLALEKYHKIYPK